MKSEPELHNLITLANVSNEVPELVQLRDIITYGPLVLIGSFQLFALFRPKVNWEAAIKQLQEEVAQSPLVRISRYFSHIKLMCLSAQIVIQDEDLFLGLNTSCLNKSGAFGHEAMKCTGVH